MTYEAERGDISISVVGDAMISRRMSVFREPNFLKLMDLVRSADVSIANLELLFHDYESSWAWSHGTYALRSEKPEGTAMDGFRRGVHRQQPFL